MFDFGETSVEGAATLQYQFRPDLLLTSSLTFLSLRSDRKGITLDPSGQDLIASLYAALRYDTRNAWSNPVEGWFLEAGFFRHGLGNDPAGWWTGRFRHAPISKDRRPAHHRGVLTP